MSDGLRGRRADKQLIGRAAGFCRNINHNKIYLWNFKGLSAARHLYEDGGFRLVEEQKGTIRGTEVNEQHFACSLTVLD
jgi:hypothetical protein